MCILRISLLSCLIFAAGAQQSPPALSSVMSQVETLLADHNSAGALQLLRAEVAKNPTSTELRAALGTVCLRAGEYDEGIAAYQAILSQPANSAQRSGSLYLLIGEGYRRKGDFESAIVNFQRSVELRPENVIGRNTLALALDAVGKKADAEREYRTILQLDPRNGVAMNNLAYLLSESGGDLEEAWNLAMHAHELLPGLDEISDTVGWISLKMNRSDAAIAVFRELVAKQPSGARYRYHLGMALAQRGDTSAAVEQLREALKYIPPDDLAARITELLMVLEK
jgi:Flp pilus assembly protein TadD